MPNAKLSRLQKDGRLLGLPAAPCRWKPRPLAPPETENDLRWV